MAQKIGIVSPELPNNVQVLSHLPEGSKVYWFLEIEAMFAYLFQDRLDALYFDENICQETHLATEKYRTFILQMRPELRINIIKVKPHREGQNLNGGQFFPKLEVMFQSGELLSVFQPIVEPINTNTRIYGYECLSRLRYNSSCFTPEFLFNYAQEKLVLSTYDKICLMQALSFVPYHKDMLIFVNIRPQTLLSANFYPWFKELLKKNHLSQDRIVLEITEQHCIISEQEMALQCQELKNQGLRIAIDDFGSGISNLALLEILKPDFIKVSGRFVKNSPQNKTKQKIIKNILELAHDLEIHAVVENVEIAKEWHLLAKLGAKLAQGFHFHKPMAQKELLALL